MRKKHIEKTSIESYIKNIDYKIIKEELKEKPKKTILLTSKYFRTLCILNALNSE